MSYPVMPLGFLGSQGDNDTYRIERSLRFNSADSAYLNRTFSTGNRKTWTWSGWIKRTILGTTQRFFTVRSGNDDTTTGEIAFETTNQLIVIGWNTVWKRTSQVFRDVSGWYHFVVAMDTTQATANNRVRVYVNGSEVTSFETTNNPTQNADLAINQNLVHYIGTASYGDYSNFYLTEVNFIDGQALTPSSFGETDAITGRWKAKAYSGTYGTNGFYLKFADNSGTTSTTLGKDSSPNGNNWTPNNFSVTAGAGNDSLVDSPTNYGTDTGVGNEVRGNYATWNPLVLNNKTGEASQVFSNANLEVRAFGDGSGSPYTHTQASIAVSTGKYYFEVTHNGSGGVGDGNDNEALIGVVNLNSSPNVGRGDGVAGESYSGNGAGYYKGGNFFALGSTVNSSGNTYGSGDIIGVAVDLQNFRVWFSKNGVWQGTGSPNPATNTSPNVSGLPTNGLYAPAVSNYAGASSRRTDFIANFGQRPFAYTAPSGFKALCTTNLPQPTIQKPSKYMDVVTYTGNGASSRTISGLGFSPDLVWIKSRSLVSNHFLFDSVRGATNVLGSNQTIAEYSNSDFGLGSGNFTIGDSGGTDDYNPNKNSATYVAWAWDAGEASSTNTAGSITSTVRVNPLAGVSIVSWTCDTSANNRVGHGLGVTPAVVLYKRRSSASDWFWTTTKVDGSFDYLLLNQTNAKVDMSASITAPTSTTFSNYGTWGGLAMIAYCFAEVEGFSRFGSYTGNGSADGPFVFTGHRPRYLLIKRTDSTGNWIILDSARSTFNANDINLFADLSNAESNPASAPIDFISNGFKLRNSGSGYNASGGTYIFAAFAESPFKYARAR